MSAPRPNQRVGRFDQLPADEAKALLEAMDSMSMTDARDQINLAAWMERRMDAIGPYGPHILDGVKRYEARIAHHDDVVRELVEALTVCRNWIDDEAAQPDTRGFDSLMALINAALAKIAQEG